MIMNKYFISIFIGAFVFTYGQNTHFNFTERPYIGILPTYVNTSVSTAVIGGKKSILIMGRDNRNIYHTDLYFYNGLNFEKNSKDVFAGLIFGDAKFFDFNNDGKMDILLAGKNPSGVNNINYYKNIGDGKFRLYETFEEDFENPSVSIADYNNDGIGDIVVMGNRLKKNNFYPATQIYSYSSDELVGFTTKTFSIKNLKNGDVKFLDINQDKKIDLVICGEDSTGENHLYTYLQKDNDFIETQSINLDFTNPKLIVGDYNKDTYPDFILLGNISATQPTPLYVYENKKDGSFQVNKLINNDLVNTGNRDFAHFADLDSDGDLDFIITGIDASHQPNIDIFENKSGIISDTKQRLGDLGGGSIALLDLDSDGNLDIFTTGGTAQSGYSSKMLMNKVKNLSVYNIENQLFNVFPNPVQNTFHLNIDIEKMEIYDPEGRLIKEFSNQKEYDISSLSRGLYLLNISVKNQQKIMKIVKQ